MNNLMPRLRTARRDRTGITLDAHRFNTAVNHAMFLGRRGRVYDRIVTLSAVRPGDTVLDVGSSSGYLTRRLAAVAGPSGHATGVDPAVPAIAYAQRYAGPSLSFTVGVAQDLPLPDEAFDVVTCTLAMHHITAGQRGAAFAEMYRVTRPGGRLLVADIMPLARMAGESGSHPDGPFADLAAAAGYRVESAGKLPLLGYLVAVRPVGGPGAGQAELRQARSPRPSRAAVLPRKTWRVTAASWPASRAT